MYQTNMIWLIAIAVLFISRIMSGSFDLMGTLLMLPGLVLALTFHEYAHAKTSDKLGDPTPEAEGRLTLNPFAHLDPIGTICLLFAGFGWGKPVNINPTYYRNPVKDGAKVAAAGPIANFILAFAMFFLYAIISILVPETQAVDIILTMLFYGAYLNVSLGVFNLLPFPPLDGSKIFAYILKGKAREFMYKLEQYSWIILTILFVTELPARIITPIVSAISFGMGVVISIIINLFV